VPAFLGSAAVRRALPWLGSWTPGAGPDVIPVALPGGRQLRIAPLICYDAVDADLVRAAVRRGADAIVTLSNDSWFATGLGPRLHLVVSAFRSIETHRPQVRATNTGISAVISPAGDLIATAGVGERATLAARIVPAGDTSTPWLAAGDWLGPAALAVAVALVARRRGRR
jgi:apolipoprotein N-acyltransferase